MLTSLHCNGNLHLPSPELLDPNEYCSKWDETKEIFEPVMTTNPPAANSIMELISYGCKTDCQCEYCENTDIEFDKPDYIADLDLDD